MRIHHDGNHSMRKPGTGNLFKTNGSEIAFLGDGGLTIW